MPLDCQHKVRFGRQSCVTACPAIAPFGIFSYARVERAEDLPAASDQAIDVRDPRHEPRLAQPGPRLARPRRPRRGLRPAGAARGHGPADARPLLRRAPVAARCPRRRADASRSTSAPAAPATSTPARTTGSPSGARGSARIPPGKRPTFRLFDAIRADETAALLGVCHTFGVMCRWSGAARARAAGQRPRARARGSSRTC